MSGQNVAFVLVVASPVLTRLRFGARWAMTLGVLGSFALLTRCEPSVVRATAMAGVAATGAALGRPTTSLRTLALGISAAVVVDPLLVTSLGFQLSVAGSAGIILAGRPVERALPGPRWATAPLSVTVAAQLAVSPLLVAAFGSVPLASLPANLLAVPVTGPIMVWGLTGGLAAGLAGGAVATVVHLPTRVALAWIDAVASASAGWPMGELRVVHVALLAVGVAGLLGARGRVRSAGSRRAGPLRFAAGVLVAGTLLVAVVARPGGAAGSGSVALGVGATAWWADGAVIVSLDGRAHDGIVLARLRAEGIDRVDVVVARTQARAVADVIGTLRRRWPTLVVLAPVPAPDRFGDEVPDAASPPGGTVLDVGGLRITVRSNAAGRLDAEVAPVAGDGAAPLPGPVDPTGAR